MKIATFNINNINRRLPNLLQWLRAASPDVVCLQELKATDKAFPTDALAGVGYRAVWKGQKTWNCLLYTSPSPRDGLLSRMPSSA